MNRWFEGFNDAAEKHILESIPVLMTAAEACDCHSVVLQAGGCRGLYPWILAEWFEEVQTIVLDDLGMSNVGLIQLDIEGLELRALHGAEGILRRDKPIVVFEDYYHRDDRKVELYLEGLGYAVWFKEADDTVMRCMS